VDCRLQMSAHILVDRCFPCAASVFEYYVLWKTGRAGL
jgi:hypothetical protein